MPGSPIAVAQETIKGRVIDNNQKPFSGVSVIVKESSIGTTTDANGEYSINVPNKELCACFSSWVIQPGN
jgi:CO dehydrogenase/acetyl-CoA synthase beta subunit